MYGMECRRSAKARARSVPPRTWARNFLVARRAKVGSSDREMFSVKLMSCEAEGNEDEKAKRVCCRVVVLF